MRGIGYFRQEREALAFPAGPTMLAIQAKVLALKAFPCVLFPVSLGLVLLSMLISGLYLRKHRAVPQYKEESAA